MDKKLIVGILIGAMIGGAFGGFIYKSRANFDADLVAYNNLAPMPTLEPTATSTPVPNCLTPAPTPTAKFIAALAAWDALEKSEMALHANDFIPMPNPKTYYQGIPVEFIDDFGPSKWEKIDLSDDDHSPGRPGSKYEKSLYEKFYNISEEKDLDKTIINGYQRRQVFGRLNNDAEFNELHKPFYGIKVIYFSFGDGCCIEDVRPSPSWIYIVWSVKHKAPIPFPYASMAVALVKRQTIKK